MTPNDKVHRAARKDMEYTNDVDRRSGGTACYPPVLDVCCGPRGMWFDKRDKRALFTDRRHETIEMAYPSGNYREEIHPDTIADFIGIEGNINAVVLDELGEGFNF